MPTASMLKNAPTAFCDIAHDIAHVFIGNQHLNVFDGFQNNGLRLRNPSLNATEVAILNAISEESTGW